MFEKGIIYATGVENTLDESNSKSLTQISGILLCLVTRQTLDLFITVKPKCNKSKVILIIQEIRAQNYLQDSPNILTLYKSNNRQTISILSTVFN